MELKISRAENKAVALVGCLLREEDRAAVALLDTAVSRTRDLVKMCSWCKKVWIPEEEWLEVEAAVTNLRLFDRSTMPGVTHGICEPCALRYFGDEDV